MRTIFPAISFDPTDEELADVIGAPLDVDAKDDDLPEATDVDFRSNVKQRNTNIIYDSDDEAEEKEIVKAAKKEEEGMNDKKPRKRVSKKDKMQLKKEQGLQGWVSSQEPSTKMRWLAEEIHRCAVEYVVPLPFVSLLFLVFVSARTNPNVPFASTELLPTNSWYSATSQPCWTSSPITSTRRESA